MSVIIQGQCSHFHRRVTVREGFMPDWPYVVKEEQTIILGGSTVYVKLSHMPGSPVYQEEVAKYESRRGVA